MRRVKIRVIGAVLSAALLITICMGCAARKEPADPIGEETTENGEAIVWIPEYKTLESVYKVTAACGADNGIYYSVGVYEEETKRQWAEIFFLDGDSKEVSALPFKGEKEGYFVNVTQMAALSNGELALVMRELDMRAEAGSGERQFLRLVSTEDGSLVAETELTADLFETGTEGFVPFMAVNQEEQIFLTDSGGGVQIYDKELQRVSTVALPGNTQLWGIGTCKEGEVVCLSYSGSEGAELYVLDPGAGDVAKVCQKNLPESWKSAESKFGASRNVLASGREQGILLKTDSGLVEYDTGTETAVSVLRWEDTDVKAEQMDFFTVLADGRIFMVLDGVDSGNGYCRAVFLSDTPADEIPEKEVITLGALGFAAELSDAVFEFNKNNDRYEIKMVDYRVDSGPRGSMEGMNEGMMHFTSELAVGKGPDMFIISSSNFKMLAEKGIMEDLYPWIEEDPELNREDYFSSVLNAYSVNGKLYGIPPFFAVYTVFAKTSVVGEESGWTVGEMMEYVKAGPKGCVAFGSGTKDSNLRKMLLFTSDSFMDWESGVCRLNEEDFIQVLEFANTFPDEIIITEGYVEKLRNGQILACEYVLKSVQDYLGLTFQFGEPITAIGYPISEGACLSIEGIFPFAINAQSDKKEGAWEFIRSFLTEEYYGTHDAYAFPTLIREYERQNEKYMTPIYYETSDGEKEELAQSSFERDGVRVEIFAATQEDVDVVTSIINECDRIYFFDIPFLEIVSEEAAPFFEGQKSAQEAADIIQSRVQLYMDENR